MYSGNGSARQLAHQVLALDIRDGAAVGSVVVVWTGVGVDDGTTNVGGLGNTAEPGVIDGLAEGDGVSVGTDVSDGA